MDVDPHTNYSFKSKVRLKIVTSFYFWKSAMKDSLKDYSNQIPEPPGFLTKQSALRQKTHKDMQAVMEKSLFLALLISGMCALDISVQKSKAIE